MAELHEPRLNLSYGWDLGETEWKTGMDANLIKIGALYALSVIDRDRTTPPGTPSEGDLHLVNHVGATDAWTGKENQVAYYINGAWRFYPPSLNWVARIESENNCLVVWNGTSWTGEIYNAEGSIIHTGTTNGTTYGASDGDLMGFWGAAPITQPADADQAAIDPNTATLVETATLTMAIRDALVDAGIIKGSA